MQSKDNTYLVQTVKDCPPKEYFPEQEYEATLITQQRTSKPVFALTFEVKFDNKIRYWLLTPTITSDGDLMVEVFRIHSNEDFRGTEFNITFKPK